MAEGSLRAGYDQGCRKFNLHDGLVIDSPVLGPIPPERLSGGLKTLIMIYEKPELIFNATSCGQNCAPWLLEIGKKEDVTINLEYLMTFPEPFEIRIENVDRIISDPKEYLITAMDFTSFYTGANAKQILQVMPEEIRTLL